MATNTSYEDRGHLECTQKEIVGFLDASNNTMVDITPYSDPTTRSGDHGTDSFETFLARPVKIYSGSIAPGAVLNDTIYPWHLWATNSWVITRLDNYAYFRGNLVLDIRINGTPFHYGKVMVSYRPLAQASNCVEPSTTADNTSSFIDTMMLKSQRLNVKLDPSCDKGGCMCLPFVWPVNMIETSKAVQWQYLGELSLDSMMRLRTVSTSTTNVNITIFAHVENLTLTVPTMSLAAQAGDEYEANGIISGPASTVQSIAARLSDVPVIAPFAMATEVGAGAVARIASIFGYSKPGNPDNARSIAAVPTGNMANAVGLDNVQKLTFDPKQEVTIDPKVTGTDSGDEMAINYLCKREGYLTYFEWSTTQNVGDTLFWMPINPSLSHFTSGANEGQIAQTPLAFATRPFQYWSGNIRIRIEIMASQYQKGRLRLSWDPHSVANTVNANSLNVTYSKVVDLQETQNYLMEIEWAKHLPYADVYMDPSTNWLLDPIAGAGSTAADNAVNGFLGVTVINELVSPVDTEPVRINVYISAGDDFEVANPIDAHFSDISYIQYVAAGGGEFSAQAGEEETADDDNANDNIPCNSLMAPSPSVGELRNRVFFGERLLSFRQLLKRYNYLGTYYHLDVSNATTYDLWMVNFRNPNFPEYYGYDPYAKYLTEQTGPVYAPFNPVCNTLLNYLTPAFVCRRGGIRNMYSAENMAQDSWSVSQMRVERDPLTTSSFGIEAFKIGQGNMSATTQSTNNNPADQYRYRGCGHQGVSLIPTHNNAVIKAELPYHSPARFYIAQNLLIQSNNSPIITECFPRREKHTFTYEYTRSNNITKSLGIDRYVAAADDFSLNYFQNAPLGFIYTDPVPKVHSEA